MNIARYIRRSNEGQALVEMAIVLPLLVLLLFGSMEFGWMFFRIHALHNVAQVAVRTAALPDASQSDVQAQADAMMDSYGMAGTGFTVTVSHEDIAAVDVGTIINVAVDVAYANVDLMGLPFIPLPENLSASVSMAKEGP